MMEGRQDPLHGAKVVEHCGVRHVHLPGDGLETHRVRALGGQELLGDAQDLFPSLFFGATATLQKVLLDPTTYIIVDSGAAHDKESLE
jgi:hypothetical protein